MSRNRSRNRVSGAWAARTMSAKTSARLGQLVLRDRHGDLARLRLDQGGEGEHGTVANSAQDTEDDEKADQARHWRLVQPGRTSNAGCVLGPGAAAECSAQSNR